MLKRYIAIASALCLVTIFIPKCPFGFVTKSSVKHPTAQAPAEVKQAASSASTSGL